MLLTEKKKFFPIAPPAAEQPSASRIDANIDTVLRNFSERPRDQCKVRREMGSETCWREAAPPLRAAVSKFAASVLQAHKKQFLPGITNAAGFLFLMDLLALAACNMLVMNRIHARLELFGQSRIVTVVLLASTVMLLLFYAAGCYRRDALLRFATAMIPFGIAVGFSAAVLTPLFHYALGSVFSADLVFRSISRSATLALLLSSIALVVGMVNRLLFFAMSQRHWFERHILVIGTGARAAYIYDLLREDSYQRFASLTFVPEAALGGPETEPAIPAELIATRQVCSLDEINAALRVDCVVVAADNDTIPLEPLLACKTSGIPVLEFNTFVERETAKVNLRWVDLSWLVYSHGFEMRAMDAVLKRIIDVTGALVMLTLALPMLAAAAVAIMLEGRGPILFRQTRVTLGSRPFELYKLRTMRVDAECNGAQWAAVKDPRVTPVGAILRRFRVDEIPQLINVLKGEMSLVGPRPERPVFVEQLSGQIQMYNLRHCVKAGVTGWAQINYPYGASVEDARCKLEYDLFYMKHFSVLRDLSILLQTCRIVLWPVGVR
jgi:sugar transferase (PEP-CTERM system associated)